MADVNSGLQRTQFTAGVNRYIVGCVEPARAALFTFQIDLNGGTCTCVPQVRVPGQTTWQAGLAYPVSSTTGSASLTSSDVYRLDATGVEVALNFTATSGSPLVSYLATVG